MKKENKKRIQITLFNKADDNEVSEDKNGKLPCASGKPAEQPEPVKAPETSDSTPETPDLKTEQATRLSASDSIPDRIFEPITVGKAKPAGTRGENKEPKARKKIPAWFLPAFLGALVAGLGVGGSVAYYWYGHFQSRQITLAVMEQQVKSLQRDKQVLSDQLEDSYLQLQNLQIGFNQMNKLFETMGDRPDKPRYKRAGEGVIIYWLDGMLWRRYHVYEARGKRGRFKKLNKRSTKKTYMYLDKLKKGTYRYVITALDRKGDETEMSDVLKIIIKH